MEHEEIDEAEVVRARGGERWSISGVIALLYGLAMMSVWFVRSGSWSGVGALGGYEGSDFGEAGD